MLSLGASTELRLGEVLVSEKLHIGGGGDGLRHTNMPGLISGKLLLSAIARVFRAGGSYTRACFMGFPSVSLATSLTRVSHGVYLVLLSFPVYFACIPDSHTAASPY